MNTTAATTSSQVVRRLLLNGDRDPVVKRLTHLVNAGRTGAAHLPDLADLEHALAQGSDPVLYTAYRDAQPARSGPEGASEVYGDLVVYETERLPGGQPVRSIGHWNTPGQVEIFQVLTGTVLMAWVTRSTRGRRLAHRTCRAGDLVVAPPGAWHVSYALEGERAAVFNIYTDLPDTGLRDNALSVPGAGHSSRQAALAPELLKYTASHPPIGLRVASGTDGPRPVLLGQPAEIWREPVPATDAVWVRRVIGDDLAAWHSAATPAQVARLHQAATRMCLAAEDK